MLIPTKKSKTGRKPRLEGLAKTAEALPDEGLQSLCEYAEFLAQKYPPVEQATLEIVPIPRPEEESIIPAIKRLAKTYPMLDKKILFDQTSAAMSEHVLNEVSAKDSIDRLEEVFRKEYEAFVDQQSSR